MEVQVKELDSESISLICDYWLNSSDEHLIGMGVDLSKVPSRESLTTMLKEQLKLPLDKRSSFALLWYLEGQAIGHCNVNQIQFGEQAHMHLHIWSQEQRDTA